jgi:tRNA U34 5-carboxymethylaminomethyl modifying GTPase MnmE/TrmE
MAYSASEDGFFEDVCAMYVEGALSAISEMDGREISKDIVDGIFSKFCVGK